MHRVGVALREVLQYPGKQVSYAAESQIEMAWTETSVWNDGRVPSYVMIFTRDNVLRDDRLY